MSNLASVYADLGRYYEASKLLEKAYSTYQHTLGEEHPDTAMTLYKIGVLNLNMKNYSIARKQLEKALRIIRITLGEKHPYVQMIEKAAENTQ